MKAKITVSWVYELNPSSYEEGMNYDQMLESDIGAYQLDPEYIMNTLDYEKYQVHGEFVGEEDA